MAHRRGLQPEGAGGLCRASSAARAWRPLRRWLALIALLLPTLPSWAAPRVDEKALIATLLYHFVQFTAWSPEHRPAGGESFVVSVIGSDALMARLDDAFRGETVGGRGVVLRRLQPHDDPADCHLLVLEGLEEAHVKRLLKATAGKPVLTAANIPGFSASGGIVEFGVARGKVVFAIDREAVKKAGLTIHSRLLNMALSPSDLEGR